MIAAAVNAKALSTYMGHASVQITFDRYGRLMPGSESEAAGLLDAYLPERCADRCADHLRAKKPARKAGIRSTTTGIRSDGRTPSPSRAAAKSGVIAPLKAALDRIC